MYSCRRMNYNGANAGNAQAKISGLPASPIILILAILWGFSAAARGQNAPPQIRLEKALENARAITNVEIQYDDMLWIKGMPDLPPPFTNDYTRTSHIKYIASGEKYRTESHNESPTSTNINKLSQTAFDGKLWS